MMSTSPQGKGHFRMHLLNCKLFGHETLQSNIYLVMVNIFRKDFAWFQITINQV